MVSAQGMAPVLAGKRRVAVIGAGVSGLSAAKCLLEESLEPVVYEQAGMIGGLWNYDEALPDGGGVMYRSLRTNASKETMAFSDFPVPTTFPAFPHHAQILEYLHAYADHFGLHPFIHLNTIVEAVAPTEAGGWSVRMRTGTTSSTETFEALVICSGRDRYPQVPALPGADTFAGTVLHSSHYKGPEAFAGQRVVVAGVGSSGVDLAVELGQVAEQVILSTTSGAWFIPRFLLGRPWDAHLTRLAERLPYRLRMILFSRLLALEYQRLGLTQASLRGRGVPFPPFDLWSARFTPCQPAFLQRLSRGDIQVKPQITQLAGQLVQFADGSTLEGDAIVWCTGYTLRFPFFPTGLVEIRDNRIELYKHVFPPAFPTLAFVGLCSAAGSHIPVAEMQGRWVAHVLSGRLRLPSRAEMEQEVERFRLHPSQQNPIPMQVQLRDYTEELAAIMGVRPHIWRHPRAILRWWFGPYSAAHYRLEGTGKRPELAPASASGGRVGKALPGTAWSDAHQAEPGLARDASPQR